MSFPWKEVEEKIRTTPTSAAQVKVHKPKITGADTLAYKYACTKRRWWVDGKIGTELKKENKEADKLLFEREVWPKYE